MLCIRVIPVILYRGLETVKGRGFDSWRSVGQVRQAIRVYERRQVDEVILLDIAATPQGKDPNIALVRELAGEFFAPVTVGGGVSTIEHFRSLLGAGADKIAINTAAHETPQLIDAAAKKFGAQAVVVSIDVRDRQVATRCGSFATGRDPVAFAREVESRGAGEILLNRIERDGTLQGYDLELVECVSQAVSIPVIACGGAGTYQHFREALDVGAHAVAASAIFAFTDSTPKGAAQYLARHGYHMRLAA